MESYVVKCDRGRANRAAPAFDSGYWTDRNFSSDADRSILGLDSHALRAELRGDAVLGPLHQAAVVWRRQRFAALMAEEPWRALFGRLMMAGPSRVLSAAEAEAIRRHAPRLR